MRITIRTVFALLAAAAGLLSQTERGPMPAVPSGVKFEVLHVRPNVYMFASSIGNVVVQVGDQAHNDGILVVDTADGRLSETIVAETKRLSGKPIRYIVNTTADPAHAGGNAAIAKAGKALDGGDSAMVIAHENVASRMSAESPGASGDVTVGWPNLTYLGGHDFYFNAEPVQLFHAPGHTDADSIVFFRNSNVIAAGDNFITTGYPVIDFERGGSIEGILAALNKILELAIPADNQEGGTMVIPGHGRLCDEADVSDYRDMITIIHDRVAAGIKKGRTLAQIQDSKPTLDYDGRYSLPAWTGAMFVEAIHRSLSEAERGETR